MDYKLLEINLSSEFEKIQIKKSNQLKIPMAMGLAIVSLIILIGALYLFVFFSNQTYEKQKRKYEKLKKNSLVAKKYIQTNAFLKVQIQKIENWNNNRIAWPQAWKKLSTLIPDQIYLESISARGLDRNQDLILLTLNGRAFGVDGESSVLDFVNKLRLDPHFSKDYDTIKMGSIISEKNEKIFSIELTHTGKNNE